MEFKKDLDNVLASEELNEQVEAELRKALEEAGLIEKYGGPNITNATDEEISEIVDGTKPAFDFLVESARIIWKEYKLWIIIILILYVSAKTFLFVVEYKENKARIKLEEENALKVKEYEREIEELKRQLDWNKSGE